MRVWFGNGYGASVVDNGSGDEYCLEVAVLHGGGLCYESPVTGDVLGWLDGDGLAVTLSAIAALPVNANCDHGGGE